MSKNRQTVLGWVFILFLLFLWASPAWGTVYKWKDENGSTHFTDNITKVPPEFRPHHTNKKPRPKKKRKTSRKKPKLKPKPKPKPEPKEKPKPKPKRVKRGKG